MKQFFLMLVGFLLVVDSYAQQANNNSTFLFDGFKKAVIYYKDGRQFSVPLNYDLVGARYLFIDQSDGGQKKEFSDPEMIVAIEIEGRTFISPTEGATEIIQAEPQFYVQYEGLSKRDGKPLPYGGKTQTAAVDSYSELQGRGAISGRELNNRVLTGIEKTYKIKIGKKNKSFSDEKRFLKLFPMYKDVLDKYIEENKIYFDNIKQVLQLYNYAISLK